MGLCLSGLPGPHVGQSLLSGQMHSASISWSVSWQGTQIQIPALTCSSPVLGRASHLHVPYSFFPFKLLCLHSIRHENELCWVLGTFSYCFPTFLLPLTSVLRENSNMYSVCAHTQWHTYTKIFTQVHMCSLTSSASQTASCLP